MRIVLILLLLCSPALAHDPNHPELNEWFNKLTSGRGLCCSFTDGFAVSDVDWESKDGHYRVRLENNWIDVPDDALITEPNRAGKTMVWPLRFNGQILIRWLHAGQHGLGRLAHQFKPAGFYFGGCKSPRSQRPRSLDFMGSSCATRVLSS
jgi:hypothetical protein